MLRFIVTENILALANPITGTGDLSIIIHALVKAIVHLLFISEMEKLIKY